MKPLAAPSRSRLRVLVLFSGLLLVAGASLWLTSLSRFGERTSPNWAGYVLPTSSRVTMISGTWTVPKLDCRVTPNARATTWVGVGGYGRAATWPFPQAGVDTDCENGHQVNDSWCSHGTFESPNISIGDDITAWLQYRGGEWNCSVADWTTGSTQVAPLIYRYSGITATAEWITENPTLTNGHKSELKTLADFHLVTFRMMKLNSQLITKHQIANSNNIVMERQAHGVLAWPSWSGRDLIVHYR